MEKMVKDGFISQLTDSISTSIHCVNAKFVDKECHCSLDKK